MKTNKIDYFKCILVTLIIIQPFIELDVHFYESFKQVGIPLISTIIRFLVLPLAIIYGFIKYDQNKKRSLIIIFTYLILLLIYFIIHCYNSIAIRDALYLPPNFIFDIIDEFIYVFTLVLPYFLIYLFYKVKFSKQEIRFIVITLSVIISLPILLSNLLGYSHSTYLGWTKDSIMSWFTNGYDNYLPRELAGKFFFIEGNTIGILLFMILPILYYYFYASLSLRQYIVTGISIIVQSLAMFILATKVATYGAIIGAILFLIILLFSSIIMKNDKLCYKSIILAITMIVITVIILPYTPAIKNLEVDAVNDKAVVEDNYMIEDGKGGVQEELKGAKTKYDPSLVYAFEQYGIKSNLMSAVPTSYYMEWYKYTYDAAWWLDILFNVPFYERVNGRQIQTLFIKYKMSETPNPRKEQALGLGYSTMMNGSLILEKDFTQQFYSFGYLGWILMISPWLMLLIYGIQKVLRNYKVLLNIKVLVFAASFTMGLSGAYMSGHILDEFTTSVFLALLVTALLTELLKIKGRKKYL